MERFGFRKHLGCWKPHLRDPINNLFVERWRGSLLFFLLSDMFMFSGEATKKKLGSFLLLIWRVLFFLRMINGVLVLVCDTFSPTPWILSRRVDHHIIDLFIYFPIFSIGVSNSFGLFCVFRLAQTHTQPTYIHLHTIYHPRKVFDNTNRSRSSRQPSNYLFYLLDFSLLSTFEIFERALIAPEIPPL